MYSLQVAGFLSHSARYGCYRCKHIFPGKVGEKYYGGFDKKAWPPRNLNEHRYFHNYYVVIMLLDNLKTQLSYELRQIFDVMLDKSTYLK